MTDHSTTEPTTNSTTTGMGRRRFLQAGAALGATAFATTLPANAFAASAPLAAAGGNNLPFSFTYGGKPSAQLLPQWPSTRQKTSNNGRMVTTTVWTDPATGLQVTWESTAYSGFPTVSWVVHFQNTGSTRSAVLADVLAADLGVDDAPGGTWTIHTNNGSSAQPTDYAPLDLDLAPDSFRLFTTNGGRPTNGNASIAAAWNAVVDGTATGYIDNTQHYSGVPGSSASLTFTGTSISWIGAKNIDVGIADVYVDGVKKASVDGYATSWLRQQTMFSSSGLSSGSHTIKIVVTGTANPSAIGNSINIDAFQAGSTVVDDADPSVTYANAPSDRTNISNGWPYFNIDQGGASGMIAAIGWPGQWAAQVTRTGQQGLGLRAGMSHRDVIVPGDQIGSTQLTSLWLDPGETIRTPSIVTQPWDEGDWLDAQNAWRRWFIQYQMPHVDGGPVPPLSPTQSNDYFPGQVDTAQDQLTWLNAYGTHAATKGTGGTTDHWWIDAGWSKLLPNSTDWNQPGSWVPDPTRYPDGLAPINDRAHALGMGTIVWFEPERVRPDTWIHDNHPEWLLKSSPSQTDNFLLDFTNPTVQDWAISHMGGLFSSQHIDVYREDFNIDPLPFWRFNDPSDRTGITQIRYVEGHLRYWQTMQAQHPGLVIDTCASGGRRLDVETMSVAINLLRSDFVLDALGNQVHQYGISRWIALSGDAARATGSADDIYVARSSMAPSFHYAVDITDPKAPWDLYEQMGAEWRSISADIYGDFYPLLPFTAGQDGWTAWSFHRPETGTGYLQAFRRPQNTVDKQILVLRGLIGTAQYQLTDLASGAQTTTTGRALMTTGLPVQLANAPSATTIRWRRL